MFDGSFFVTAAAAIVFCFTAVASFVAVTRLVAAGTLRLDLCSANGAEGTFLRYLGGTVSAYGGLLVLCAFSLHSGNIIDELICLHDKGSDLRGMLCTGLLRVVEKSAYFSIAGLKLTLGYVKVVLELSEVGELSCFLYRECRRIT